MNTGTIKSNLRDYYNRDAGRRDGGGKQDWKIREREAFCHLAVGENKKSLLEIGAGTGHDSRYFIEQGFDVVAVDLSDEMVKVCKKKCIEAYELDFYGLHMLERQFDCIWAMNCLLHVPKSDFLRVLGGIDAALNENGLFFMGVYGGRDTEDEWVNDLDDTPRFFSYYSEPKLKEALQGVFDIVRFEQYDVGRNIDFQSVVMKKRAGL